MNNNISTVLNGTDQVSTSSEGVVNNQGNTMLMDSLGNPGNVGNNVLGVRDRLDKDGLGLGVDQLGKGLRLVRVSELDLDSQAGEKDLKLVVGAAVEMRRGDDVVTGLGQSADG